MGLPKYKQDENARHRLWLTVVLENLPQIIISTSYATSLAGFDTTVLAALISSIASVVLALLSAYLEFPKKYYIYQMGIQLKSSQNTQLRKRLRMRHALSIVICKSMDRERGFIFAENIYYNGKDFVCFNVVSSEPITAFDFDNKQKMINLLLNNNKLRIKCNNIIFRFVCCKSVPLMPHCLCGDSENSNTDAQNNADSEKVMSEIVSATRAQHNGGKNDQIELN